jgi:error-prone DNA polymerase
MMKVDVLALGMLTCIRKCFDLIADHKGERFALATIPQDDQQVYDMLCRGESLGVFQVESRAQMNMLPRLKPRVFYDLVIEVAIVRPGPIQGDMVHPYLRRRNKIEKVSYPSPSPKHGDPDELFKVLHKTLGVPLFQEQAMRIAIEAAKFTPEEANGLRRSMATFRNVGTIGKFESKMIGNMIARGYTPEFAKSCFDQIKGFGSYGFPESHAASFAQLVLAETLPSRCVLLRIAQLAADGLLRPGADRRRCSQERRRGAGDRCVLLFRREHAGRDLRSLLRGPARLSPDRRLSLARCG